MLWLIAELKKEGLPSHEGSGLKCDSYLAGRFRLQSLPSHEGSGLKLREKLELVFVCESPLA